MATTIFFSPSTRGFYRKGVHRSIPDDAHALSERRYKQLIAAQARSGSIRIDRAGRPVAARVAGASERRADLVAQIQAEARRRIEAISPPWRQMNDLREPSPSGAARFAAIDEIRAASTLIEQDLAETAVGALGNFPIADHPLWPEIS